MRLGTLIFEQSIMKKVVVINSELGPLWDHGLDASDRAR